MKTTILKQKLIQIFMYPLFAHTFLLPLLKKLLIIFTNSALCGIFCTIIKKAKQNWKVTFERCFIYIHMDPKESHLICHNLLQCNMTQYKSIQMLCNYFAVIMALTYNLEHNCNANSQSPNL